MSEFIGVRSALDVTNSSLLTSLKRDALVLDRIAVPMLSGMLESPNTTERFRNNVAQLQWLFEQGLVFEPPNVTDLRYPAVGKVFAAEVKNLRRLGYEITHTRVPRARTPASLKYAARLFAFGLLSARLTASYMRESQHLDASAWSSMITTREDNEVRLDKVLGVVIDNLPIPDEQTPWEHILEFRLDPDSRSRFLALRNWIREMIKNELPRHEIEDKLEYLIDEHERHMRLHKMKISKSTLETLVITSTEMIENLVKIKWSEAAKKLFSFKERRIALVEAELNSPAREVAFILDAHEKFGS